MLKSMTPEWGINTVCIDTITIVTVRLRMLHKYASKSILQDLHELGVRTSYHVTKGKEYVTIKYSGIPSVKCDTVLALLHKLRYESALTQVYDKYNTNHSGGAVAADYGNNSFFDPMEAEL